MKKSYFKLVLIMLLIIATAVPSYAEYGAIVIDGYYDDWEDKPHTDVYNGQGGPNHQINHVALFRDEENAYVHIIFSEKGNNVIKNMTINIYTNMGDESFWAASDIYSGQISEAYDSNQNQGGENASQASAANESNKENTSVDGKSESDNQITSNVNQADQKVVDEKTVSTVEMNQDKQNETDSSEQQDPGSPIQDSQTQDGQAQDGQTQDSQANENSVEDGNDSSFDPQTDSSIMDDNPSQQKEEGDTTVDEASSVDEMNPDQNENNQEPQPSEQDEQVSDHQNQNQDTEIPVQQDEEQEKSEEEVVQDMSDLLPTSEQGILEPDWNLFPDLDQISEVITPEYSGTKTFTVYQGLDPVGWGYYTSDNGDQDEAEFCIPLSTITNQYDGITDISMKIRKLGKQTIISVGADTAPYIGIAISIAVIAASFGRFAYKQNKFMWNKG